MSRSLFMPPRRVAMLPVEMAARRRFMMSEPGVMEMNPVMAALGDFGALEDPGEVATRLSTQMNEVNDRLYALVNDTSWSQRLFQRAHSAQTFKERVDQWHSSAVGWQESAGRVVAANDPANFDAWTKAGVNIMTTAQDYASEIQDTTLLSLTGAFIRNIPSSTSIVWTKGVVAGTVGVVHGVGTVASSLTWAAAKPILLAVGVISVGVYVLGKTMKSAGVKINTPWATVGGGDSSPSAPAGPSMWSKIRAALPGKVPGGAVSGYAGVSRRPRRRRRRSR